MRSRIFICIVFIFAFWLTSANLTKAQGGNATVGSSPIIKKPATPPKKPAVKPPGSRPLPKPKTSSQSKSTAKIANKPKSTVKNKTTAKDNISPPVGGAGLGGESLRVGDNYIGSGLYNKWEQLGGESSVLGLPITNELEAGRSPQGTTGRYAEFRGGFVIWHSSGRLLDNTFSVDGCFFKLYKQVGGTGSFLGFPVVDAYAAGGGSRQDFEGGYMLWDSKTSVCQAYRNQ